MKKDHRHQRRSDEQPSHVAALQREHERKSGDQFRHRFLAAFQAIANRYRSIHDPADPVDVHLQGLKASRFRPYGFRGQTVGELGIGGFLPGGDR